MKKEVKNLYTPTVFGIGYKGVGEHKATIDGKKTKVYQTWQGMLERCYNEKSLIKCPTYRDCSVSEEWHNFQNFAEWFEQNYTEGFELDKDLLVRNNKVYSSSTCRFVPKEVNRLLIKSNNTRGDYPIGVTKEGNKFIAQFNKGKGRQVYLGSFDTPEEAFQAYKKAKEDYIKTIANKWKDKIDMQIYSNLIKYEVKIVD